MFGILWVAIFLLIDLINLMFGILATKEKIQDTNSFALFRVIISVLLLIAFILNIII